MPSLDDVAPAPWNSPQPTIPDNQQQSLTIAPTQPQSSSAQSSSALDSVPNAPWNEPGARNAAPVSAPIAGSSPTSQPAPKTDQPKEEPSFWANTGTGLARAAGTIAGIPHQLADVYTGIAGDQGNGSISNWIKSNTPTADQATNIVFNDVNALNSGNPSDLLYQNPNAIKGDIQPYVPQTFPGRIYQNTVASAPLAAIGPESVPGLLSNQAANLAGNAGVETAKEIAPNNPMAQTIAGVATSLIPGGAMAAGRLAGSSLWNAGSRLIGTQGAVNNAAAKSLVNAAQMSPSDLSDSIDANLGSWQFPGLAEQPKPTTAAVTQNPGLLSLTYNNRAQNPIPYAENAAATNAAQRAAISNATPDITPIQANNQQVLTGLLSRLPQGVTAQDAGATFRQGLQNVYDQRLQNRQALGSSVFDPLDQSPAYINLRPVMDYATTQAAQTPGEVGAAYKSALGQFSTPTGLTLDTAPFANSVLKSLGDLSQNYPAGSAASRAVLDVKGRAENEIFNQEPAIAQARQAYAQASQPLDVFDPSHTPGPIANAVQTTRFGGYTTPNDSVVSTFLRGNGAPDAIDKLNSIFPDVKLATQSLQDYIASQVQQRAVVNGKVDQQALQSVLAPYQGVLNKLPFVGINRQFNNISNAQAMVDQMTARQKMFDTFQNELGTGKLDQNGTSFYSATKFDNFVTKNQPDLVNAYGKDGASTINQVNDQLQKIAQEAQARVPGQSGTPQAMHGGAGNQNMSIMKAIFYETLGGGIGDIMGTLSTLHGHSSVLGIAMGVGGHVAGVVPLLRQRFNGLVDQATTKALTDPIFAKSLMTTYNPKLPSQASVRALNYVRNHLSGLTAPLTNVAQ